MMPASLMISGLVPNTVATEPGVRSATARAPAAACGASGARESLRAHGSLPCFNSRYRVVLK